MPFAGTESQAASAERPEPLAEAAGGIPPPTQPWRTGTSPRLSYSGATTTSRTLVSGGRFALVKAVYLLSKRLEEVLTSR